MTIVRVGTSMPILLLKHSIAQWSHAPFYPHLQRSQDIWTPLPSPDEVIHFFPAENLGLRLKGANSHLHCFKLTANHSSVCSRLQSDEANRATSSAKNRQHFWVPQTGHFAPTCCNFALFSNQPYYVGNSLSSGCMGDNHYSELLFYRSVSWQPL